RQFPKSFRTSATLRCSGSERLKHAIEAGIELACDRLNQEKSYLDTATIWSALAKRSGDGALAPRACLTTVKAVSRFACHRTPHIPHTTNSVWWRNALGQR